MYTRDGLFNWYGTCRTYLVRLAPISGYIHSSDLHMFRFHPEPSLFSGRYWVLLRLLPRCWPWGLQPDQTKSSPRLRFASVTLEKLDLNNSMAPLSELGEMGNHARHGEGYLLTEPVTGFGYAEIEAGARIVAHLEARTPPWRAGAVSWMICGPDSERKRMIIAHLLCRGALVFFYLCHGVVMV